MPLRERTTVSQQRVFRTDAEPVICVGVVVVTYSSESNTLEHLKARSRKGFQTLETSVLDKYLFSSALIRVRVRVRPSVRCV